MRLLTLLKLLVNNLFNILMVADRRFCLSSSYSLCTAPFKLPRKSITRPQDREMIVSKREILVMSGHADEIVCPEFQPQDHSNYWDDSPNFEGDQTTARRAWEWCFHQQLVKPAN